MVMIQVLIAEVRLNDTDEFGVELGLQDSLLFDRSLVDTIQTTTNTVQTSTDRASSPTRQQNIINAPLNPGFNFNNTNPLGNNGSTTALATAANVAAQGLSNFAMGRASPDLGFGGFVFSASSNGVSVLLRALQEKRRLEVLSRPQIMALDGQPGYVQVGQRVPTITGVSLDHVRPDERHLVPAGRPHHAGHAADQPRRPGGDAAHDRKVGSRAGSGRHSDLGLGGRPDRAGAADQRHDGGHDGQRAERPDGRAQRPA